MNRARRAVVPFGGTVRAIPGPMFTVVPWVQPEHTARRHSMLPHTMMHPVKRVAVLVETVSAVDDTPPLIGFLVVMSRVERFAGMLRDSAVPALNRATKRAGLPRYRSQDLHDSWTSIQLMGGTPVERLAKMGGWSRVTMLYEVYGHIIPADFRDGADVMDAALGASRKL